MMIENQKQKKKLNKNLFYSLLFLFFTMMLYLILFLVDPGKTMISLIKSFDIIIQITPVLIFVIIIMGVSNCFLKPKTVSKHLGAGSGVKGWFLAVSMGILSHGPIYVWYPLLRDLKTHGMRSGLAAVFLYNRAIKIPLLPMMIFYFGVNFVVVLTVYMIIASIVEGKIIEKIEHKGGVENV